MREIVLDTETTGLDPSEGHRMVEIGGVELMNGCPTGGTFHVYLNPERDVPYEAYKIHGLSTSFLSGHPTFGDVVDDFLAFISTSPLVIHNAEFDLKFLNAELARVGRSIFPKDRIVDSLALARKKYPGASNSLDALCARFRIDLTNRTKHGALIDAQLLAEVYSELNGGRQSTLTLVEKAQTNKGAPQRPPLRRNPDAFVSLLQFAELCEHAQAINSLIDRAIWRQFYPVEADALRVSTVN